MKKRLFSMILSATLVMGAVTGCGAAKADGAADGAAKADSTAKADSATKADAEVKPAEKDDIVVGSVIMNTSGEWFAEIMQGMEGAGKDLGVKVNIVSSDNEVSKESDNVGTFVAQGVDAITICPISADASVAAVQAAQGEDIPVVTWNTTVNAEVDSHVGVSNYDLGKLTGEYVAEYVKEAYPDGAKLAILGNTSYEIGVERCNGFKDAIKGIDGLEIVAEQDAEMQDEGLDITEQIMTANPDIDIFWAWNQTSLLGCATHMQNIGNKDIVIMGTDMSVDLAKTMLGDSVTLQAITTQMPYEIGYNAVQNAVKLVKGESVEKKMSIELKTYIKDDVEGLEAYIADREDLKVQ